MFRDFGEQHDCPSWVGFFSNFIIQNMHAARRQLSNLAGRNGLRSGFQSRLAWGATPEPEILAKMDSYYDSTVESLARQPIVPLTLRQMLAMGRGLLRGPDHIVTSARFVQQELPKRLARRLLDLQLLPHLVVSNPHIRHVYGAYFQMLENLRALPEVCTLQDNERFTELLRQLMDDNAPMLDLLATGLREVRCRPLVGERLALDMFLENMLRSRIGRRTLAEQHIYLSQPREGYVGVISMHMSLAEGIEFAAQRCRQVCGETYGVAPEVFISGDRRLHLPYIPSHFDYILYEVLKNSARAVVERHFAPMAGQDDASVGMSRHLPPIRVRICNADEHVVLRISDEGGGIPLGLAPKIWQFGFTTIGSQGTAMDTSKTEGLAFDPSYGAAWDVSQIPATSGGRFRMGGLGFGLPLSRLYARFFGGDLALQSMPGYGTDTYLTLQRLDNTDWQEQAVEDFTSPMPNLHESSQRGA